MNEKEKEKKQETPGKEAKKTRTRIEEPVTVPPDDDVTDDNGVGDDNDTDSDCITAAFCTINIYGNPNVYIYNGRRKGKKKDDLVKKVIAIMKDSSITKFIAAVIKAIRSKPGEKE